MTRPEAGTAPRRRAKCGGYAVARRQCVTSEASLEVRSRFLPGTEEAQRGERPAQGTLSGAADPLIDQAVEDLLRH